MNRDDFKVLYEEIVKDIASLEEYETEPKLECRSFDEFKHFCKSLNLRCELSENDNNEKVQECSLYFMNEFDNDRNQIRFDYYNQIMPEYHRQFKDIFDKLNDYKKHYIVTLTGELKSPRIIWG